MANKFPFSKVTLTQYSENYSSLFQVIIPGIWMFSFILDIPVFLTMKSQGNSCLSSFPEEWMNKAFTSIINFVFVLLPLALMIVLYSKVVHTLWFKRNDGNQLTDQQIVSVRLTKGPLRV